MQFNYESQYILSHSSKRCLSLRWSRLKLIRNFQEVFKTFLIGMTEQDRIHVALCRTKLEDEVPPSRAPSF